MTYRPAIFFLRQWQQFWWFSFWSRVWRVGGKLRHQSLKLAGVRLSRPSPVCCWLSSCCRMPEWCNGSYTWQYLELKFSSRVNFKDRAHTRIHEPKDFDSF